MAPVEVLASLPPLMLLLLLLLLRLREGSRAASVATAKTCSTTAATSSTLPFSRAEKTTREKASTEAFAERLACDAPCSPQQSVARQASTC